MPEQAACGASCPREGVKFLPGWGTKIFTRPSRARARKPTSVATADVYPTEQREGVYPEERSEDVVVYPTECNEGVVVAATPRAGHSRPFGAGACARGHAL